MTLALQVTGALLLPLALMHLAFPKRFRWAEELARLSLLNRQLMQVHTFFLAYMLALMGGLCLFFAQEMTSTRLGRALSGGLASFWGLRLFVQLFVYKPQLWRGKAFETFVHVTFTLLWLFITIVFVVAAVPSLPCMQH